MTSKGQSHRLNFLLMMVLASTAPAAAEPLGSAFTYQGQLSGASGPVSGACDLRFRLYDAVTSGVQQGPEVPRSGQAVASGLFAVELDFAVAFAGERRWLEVDVRCPAGAGAFTTLPRQEITPAPYSLTSLSTIALRGRPVSAAVPASGDVLAWNGTAWAPNSPAVASGTPANTPNSLVQRDAAGRFAAGGIALDAGSAATPALTAGADGGVFGSPGGVGIGAAGAEAARFTSSLATIQPPLQTGSDITQLSGVLTLASSGSGGRIRQDGSNLVHQSGRSVGWSLYLGHGSGEVGNNDFGANLGVGGDALSQPDPVEGCDFGFLRNTAVGDSALSRFRCGNRNLAVGANAGNRLSEGNGNMYLGSPGPPEPTEEESDTTRIGSQQTRTFVAGIYDRDQPHAHVDFGAFELEQNERRLVTADAAGQLGAAWVPTIVWGQWDRKPFPLIAEAASFCQHGLVLGCGCIGDQGQVFHQVAFESSVSGHTVRGCECRLRPDLLAINAGVVAQAICLEPAP